MKLKISSKHSPSGDQPNAISALLAGITNGQRDQVLLGITGSGKTFAMANVIEKSGRPAIVIAPNKMLAMQLFNEMRTLFPSNAVEFFVSHYDYYQPEAYIPRTDVFIQKDASLNAHIEMLRHSATVSVLERRDFVVVASVSCIYGIGGPAFYSSMTLPLNVNRECSRQSVLNTLVDLQYARNDVELARGRFRVRGENIDVFPSHIEKHAWRLNFNGDQLSALYSIDPINSRILEEFSNVKLYANSHYVTPKEVVADAIKHIREEMEERVREFERNGKPLEAQRIKHRTLMDIEMLETTGSCKGIENYSRYLTGRRRGDSPPTIFEYLPEDALCFVDESHITVPQLGAMYNGDRARKEVLVQYGFRLPSALDNRPLKFEEWNKMRPETIFVSATPGEFELERSEGRIIEQIIRPTGLLDPNCEVRPAKNQVEDLMLEISLCVKNGHRVLVSAITKKMAEDLAGYLKELNYKASYLHSEVKTLDRMKVINDLRSGKSDVLVGVNLLREGLDVPECGLVAILDADKEGFLRSEVSLIQTIGRAARNADGRAILYADVVTDSMKKALGITRKRRQMQMAYNKEHGIVPKTIERPVFDFLDIQTKEIKESFDKKVFTSEKALQAHLNSLRKEMKVAAENLEFEKAASIRDEISKLEKSGIFIFGS